ncbi:hypothetical protein Geu3261_0127_002 [Komagataeibacter europaeus NBRC 3261]|uniref:Uncharacterized protein n=1 Tax=Komagataeibacter europaeus NBRC 3261 TaxID=1234669 RepID=A0A0D6Q0E7_KOMEU|nr:hypothetical protein Geu3261_0127_002 [Komagataeibacter europaeus NBRC 3261]
MPRIRQQRQRMAAHAPRRFPDDIDKVERDADGKRPAIGCRRVDMVVAKQPAMVVPAVVTCMVMSVMVVVTMARMTIGTVGVVGVMAMIVVVPMAVMVAMVMLALTHGAASIQQWD